MTRNLTANARSDDQTFENDCSSLVGEGLVEEFQDRNEGQGAKQPVEVLHTEEHRNRIEPSSNEANGHSAHDGDWNHLLGSGDLLCHVCSTIQARERPIGVD